MTTPSNAEIAATLDRFGTLLALANEGPFRVRAYQRAAEAIRYLDRSVVDAVRAGDLESVPGVGKGIAAAVGEIVATGHYRPLDELERDIPPTLLDVLAIPGVGVKTAARLYRELGITDLASLEAAAVAGRLRDVRGFGGRLERTILAGLESLRRRSGRIPLGVALPLARDLAAAVAARLPGAEVSIAGSVRRMEETAADVDLVVGSPEPAAALAKIVELPLVAEALEQGDGWLRVRLQSGVEADLFVVPREAFGSTLVRATGSAAHLALLGDPLPTAATEAEVYAARGLPWIPPELRQGRDEVSRSGELDRLVTVAAINGEFHSHTTWSDGSASVAEMADAAAGRGYAFLGISDHSHGLGVANGLDPTRLRAQRRQIDALNAEGGRPRLFAGAEVEVSRGGGLDFDDRVLADLDVVIASLHVGLRQPRVELTDRLLGVLHNRNVDIIAHPSGRLIERRDPGDFDWDRVFETAAETGTALEINADPARLDLSDALARRALAAGCLLTINCDAHQPSGFAAIEYGVAVARRAWATPDRVLNCWPPPRIEAWLRERDTTA